MICRAVIDWLGQIRGQREVRQLLHPSSSSRGFLGSHPDSGRFEARVAGKLTPAAAPRTRD